VFKSSQSGTNATNTRRQIVSDNSLAMMPWFPRDFIAATRAMRLAERGAYRELLDYQWEMGKLPADHERLARLLGVTIDEFEAIWPAISDKFCTVDGGLANTRLEEHRLKSLERRDRKRNGAASTNAKRYGQRDAKRSLSEPLSVSPPSPSPSPEVREIATQSPGGDEFAKHFALLKSIYPKRSGDQRWPTAEKHIRARLREGSTWTEILDGVRRYAEWVRAAGKEGTETVKQAATFVGTDRGFTEAFELPRGVNGTGKQSYQPRPSAVERVRLATERFIREGEDSGGGGLVIDG
jgi:uncharacterized protein YdaU (DUF1376 family)